MTLLVRCPPDYLPERQYVLDLVLAEWLGLEYHMDSGRGSRTTIELVGDPRAGELTLPDVLFATPTEDWLTERSMPAVPLARIQVGPIPAAGGAPNGLPPDGLPAGEIPVLFGDPGAQQAAWQATAAGGSVSVDIFGSVFFLLSRYEEVVRPARDLHERFPGAASLAATEEFLERPIVDEYVDLLWSAMHALWPALVRRPSTFRLRLTHDVDWPWAAMGQRIGTVARAVAGDLLRRHDPVLAAQRARSLVDARAGRIDRDPFNTFDFLMDTSERHGLRSTFYFMAGRTNPRIDGNYRLSDPPVADLLRRIHDRGHEVGLHASYGTHRSAELTQAELEGLRAACRAVGFDQATWGVRQHYLRFDNPDTWRSQELAGIDHDSTLGFADRIGFRAGTCREYPVFDLLEHRTLRLRERPLVAMDATLFAHLGLELDDAARRTRAVVAVCRRHRGDAVLLYHNSSLPGARQRAHYRDLVAELVRPA